VRLFGFEIRKAQDDKPALPTFSTEVKDDGAVQVAAGGTQGIFVDIEGTVKTEADLVTRYREMSLQPEIVKAVHSIVNEIVVEDESQNIVDLSLDDFEDEEMPPQIKQSFKAEFKNVLKLLEFHTHAFEILCRYYIDGRLYYHIIIDPKQEEAGIQELRFLDPRKIRKVREVSKKMNGAGGTLEQKVTTVSTKNEYYIYTEAGLNAKTNFSNTPTTALKIAKDAIAHVTSGLTNADNTMVLSYLHAAIKIMNQLRYLEDATIIYRITRAPERRVFYIDVGNLPKFKAEQYMRDMMVKHRNKLSYDTSSGEIKQDTKFTTMLEDIWIPRRGGDQGTKIDQLEGGQTLGQMDDVLYFQKKLYMALNVPIGRLDPEYLNALGRATEITRDEIAFAKFVARLRRKFNGLFLNILRTQLVLKRVILPEEFDRISHRIRFKYAKDNHSEELKNQEILMTRMEILQQMQTTGVVGKYYSNKEVQTKILYQTEDDINTNRIEIMNEVSDPIYNPPMPEEQERGPPK
jgi:hypothetical protein